MEILFTILLFGFIWILLAILVGCAASSRGRSSFGWFLLSITVSPFFSILLLIAYPSRNRVPHLSLSEAMLEERLRSDLGPYVRQYKPSFSNSVVYTVGIDGEKIKFNTEGAAFAYVARLKQYRIEDARKSIGI